MINDQGSFKVERAAAIKSGNPALVRACWLKFGYQRQVEGLTDDELMRQVKLVPIWED
jgi:hypothetical protein